MKLSEKTRKQLRTGKATELRFPVRRGKVGAIRPCPVKEGRAYPVENEEGHEHGEFTVMVVVRDIEAGEWRVFVRPGADQPRMPAKGGGYTSVPSLAMRRGDDDGGAEIEAVPEDCGRRLSDGGNCCQKHISEAAREANAERQADQKRIRKLEDVQRKARARGVDMKPLAEVLDTEIEKWSRRMESEESSREKAA